jgi:hypothetical protein
MRELQKNKYTYKSDQVIILNKNNRFNGRKANKNDKDFNEMSKRSSVL